MRLSLCLIVRDEATRLARAVESFAGVADEVVVTDTGSTDDTVDVARRLGARVDHFAWCDDFAAARNHNFAQATGDWIFMLDGDEWLLPASAEEVRRTLERPEALAAYVLREERTGGSDANAFSAMLQLRLWRRDQVPAMIGRCHMHFEPPLELVAKAQGRQVLETDIRIGHDGYVAARKPEKLARALRLLRLELADRPGQPYYEVELMATLLRAGDPEGVDLLVALAPRALGPEGQTWPAASLGMWLEAALQTPPERLPVPQDRLENLVLQKMADWPPLLYQVARRRFDRGEFAEALAVLERVQRLLIQGANRIVAFDLDALSADARFLAGCARLRNAELPEAEVLFTDLLGDRRHGTAAEANLTTVRDLRQRFGV